MSWLRPTFRIERGIAYDYQREVKLKPIIIAVLEVDEASGTAVCDVLGSQTSPYRTGLAGLRKMLAERGRQL